MRFLLFLKIRIMDNHPRQYTCPMHPEILQDKPGNCPECGMKLIPFNDKQNEEHLPYHHSEPEKEEYSSHVPNTAVVVKMSVPPPGEDAVQTFQRYTSPMHPQIVQDEPGKCPLCGMTLVPLKKTGAHNIHEKHSSCISDLQMRFNLVAILTIPDIK